MEFPIRQKRISARPLAKCPAIAAPLRGRSPAVRPARARLPYRLAGQMERFARGSIDQCRDCIMATLSHKPSTRTRFSFKAAKLHVVGGT